jgi:hypothetical protein
MDNQLNAPARIQKDVKSAQLSCFNLAEFVALLTRDTGKFARSSVKGRIPEMASGCVSVSRGDRIELRII